MRPELHSAAWFIEFFSAIPDDKWCVRDTGEPGTPRCALGHAFGSVRHNKRSQDLVALFETVDTNCLALVRVNNGDHPDYQQPTPKLRILAALHDIAAKQLPPPAPAVQKIPQPCCHLWLGMNCVYCGTAQPAQNVEAQCS